MVVKGYINAARRESVAAANPSLASPPSSSNSLAVPVPDGEEATHTPSPSPATVPGNTETPRSWFRRTRSPAILHAGRGRRRRLESVSAAQWARLDIFEAAKGLEMDSGSLSFFDLPSV